MSADLTGDEIGAPERPRLCPHHAAVIANLAHLDHVGDSDSERAAVEMARQCCGRTR